MGINVRSGQSIYNVKSNDMTIEVRENRQHRWLHFGDGSIQSAMSLSDPHSIVLPYLNLLIRGLEILQPKPTKALILGLGGGSITRYLRHHHPNLDLTVVEINGDVIDIAHKFFKVPQDSNNFHIIHGDACKFLEESQERYDLLISDLYCDNDIPNFLMTKKYHQQCFEVLDADGLAIINLVIERHGDLKKYLEIIREIYRNSTLTMPVKYYLNHLIFAIKGNDFFQRMQALHERGDIVEIKYDFEYGYIAEDLISKTEICQALYSLLFPKL